MSDATRRRPGDRLFEVVLCGILQREFHAGTPLPSQSKLADVFGVSRRTVGRATRRLGELGLVRVRPGCRTIVLDARQTTDVSLIQLHLAIASTSNAIARDITEYCALSILPRLAIAERRITLAQLDNLDWLVGGYRCDMRPDERESFETEYWEEVARATHNPLFLRQVQLWFSVTRGVRSQARWPEPFPRDFYEALNAALRRRSGSVRIWCDRILSAPILSVVPPLRCQ